jgi:hypothetical protein
MEMEKGGEEMTNDTGTDSASTGEYCPDCGAHLPERETHDEACSRPDLPKKRYRVLATSETDLYAVVEAATPEAARMAAADNAGDYEWYEDGTGWANGAFTVSDDEPNEYEENA